MNDVYKEHIFKQNQLRIREQKKLYYYYVGRDDKIRKYLEDALLITFDSEQLDDFQLDYINVTKKIIDQLAIVYDSKADRYFINEYKLLKKEREKAKWTNYLNRILPFDVNKKDKKAHRYGMLLNTSLTQVIFDGKGIDYVVRPSHLYDIIPDENDPYKIKKLRYKQYVKQKDKDILGTFEWTNESFNVYDEYGNVLTYGDNVNGVNPYGRIPFAIYREQEDEDFWGEGQFDLVNCNEIINFLLTDLVNGGIIMQAWGTPVAVNLGLSYKGVDGTEQPGKKVRWGPKHPIIVETRNKMPGQSEPKLTYENANPLIREVMDVIDWKIKTIAMMKGLNPNTIVAKLTDTSGFAKLVDSVNQNEVRRRSLETARAYEQERFEITKVVNNTEAGTRRGKEAGLEKIPDDLAFNVDFAEIRFDMSTETQMLLDDYKLKRNIVSIIDLARRDNPDLTDKEIKELIEVNKKINDELLPEPENLSVDNNITNVATKAGEPNE